MGEEKLKDIPEEKISPLYEAMCEAIHTRLREDLDNPGISKEEIQSAREFAGMKPDSKAAKELLEFLESEEVKEAIITGVLGLK